MAGVGRDTRQENCLRQPWGRWLVLALRSLAQSAAHTGKGQEGRMECSIFRNIYLIP